MSNVFFYEPAYNFDRFFEHAFQPLINTAGASSKLERTNPAAPRPIKPRHVISSVIQKLNADSPRRMDLHEDSEKNLVSAIFELPGINKDSVHLEIRDGHLTVSAETKSSMEYEKNGYAVRERQYGKLARTLRLPKGVKVRLPMFAPQHF
jgi:HSP20 family protein